ncbi:hypothetical protein R3X28_02340 [Maribacter sp. TH_r10]|uniref:hypothetical protein n=1 Tax=Maribacter TaxID=252356 RepID=UPI002491DC45|nr:MULTISPECIES: hypothetical protein [Maribacter]MDV7137692.1 hypothetical protein [Maribacter sp. TH_r10]
MRFFRRVSNQISEVHAILVKDSRQGVVVNYSEVYEIGNRLPLYMHKEMGCLYFFTQVGPFILGKVDKDFSGTGIIRDHSQVRVTSNLFLKP